MPSPGNRILLYSLLHTALVELTAWTEARLSSPATGPPLRTVHRQLLSVITSTPQPTKVLARLAGYKAGSYVRTALAELVRWGLVQHGPEGYSR